MDHWTTLCEWLTVEESFLAVSDRHTYMRHTHTHTKSQLCLDLGSKFCSIYLTQLEKKNIIIECCLLWSSRRCVCAYFCIYISVLYTVCVLYMCSEKKNVYPLPSPRSVYRVGELVGWGWRLMHFISFHSSWHGLRGKITFRPTRNRC